MQCLSIQICCGCIQIKNKLHLIIIWRVNKRCSNDYMLLLLTTLTTLFLHDTYIASFVTLKMYIASHSPLVTWIAFSCVVRHLSYWILQNSFRTVDQCRTLCLTYHRAIDVMNMLITIFVTKNFVVWTAVWCKIWCRNKELKQWKKNSRWDMRLSKLFSRLYYTC